MSMALPWGEELWGVQLFVAFVLTPDKSIVTMSTVLWAAGNWKLPRGPCNERARGKLVLRSIWTTWGLMSQQWQRAYTVRPVVNKTQSLPYFVAIQTKLLFSGCTELSSFPQEHVCAAHLKPLEEVPKQRNEPSHLGSRAWFPWKLYWMHHQTWEIEVHMVGGLPSLPEPRLARVSDSKG